MQVRLTRSLAVALASIVGIAGLWTATAASAAPPEFVPGEVIVKFKAGTEAQERQAALATLDADAAERIGTPRTRVIELDSTLSVSQAIAELESRPEIAWAEPNWVVTAAEVTPDDPLFRNGSLWGMRNTGQTVQQVVDVGGSKEDRAGRAGMDANVVDAWSATTGDSDVLVGVIDSGVARHEDLNGNLRTDLSRDFASPDLSADPFADAVSHGTHVAGTIGAVGDNGIGVTGVNWDVGLVAIRALSDMQGTASAIAQSLAYAGQLGLPVANVSITSSAMSRSIADAVRLAPGTLFVVSAGNEAVDVDGTDTLPCTLPYENVICVAATGNIGELAPFSNFGAREVDIGAPGNEILSTVPEFETVHEFPIDPDVFDDGRWSTGPEDQKWVVDGPEDDMLASNPAGELEPGIDNWVKSAQFSLTDRVGCTWQGFYGLEASLPGEPVGGFLVFERQFGGVSWTELSREFVPTDGKPFSHSLQADGLGQVAVRARFVTTAAADENLDGAWLADMEIVCQDGESSGTYETESGTSMSAPMVAGAAGLLLARNPDLTTAELREAILSTATPTNSLAGRTVTGARLNVAAAMEAVEPPEPPQPPPPPQLRAGIWPGQMPLLRHRGLVFGATANHSAAITARAVVRWRGAAVRRGDRVLRIRPGAIRLRHLTVGRPAPWNPRGRMVEPGRISPMLLRPTRRQLRHIVRVQRLTGQPLRVNLAARAFAPETNPWPVMFRGYRLR